MNIALQAHHLSRDFGNFRALDDISLTIPKGMIFGLLGPNGAGKTTLFHLLLGLLAPTSGHVEVLGFDTQTHADQIRFSTGVLLEYSGLYERLDAYDNLDFYARAWHLSRKERQQRIQELLMHVDLWTRRKERVGTWSRGMKQKLAIARAFLHRPSLIILDEPTSGLDPLAAKVLCDDLKTLATQEGVTVLFSTHNLNEAEQLCQQIGILYRGKLLAVNAPETLHKQPGRQRLTIVGQDLHRVNLPLLRQDPMITSVEIVENHLMLEMQESGETASLVNRLVTMGVQIEEVRKDKTRLEEVFLALLEEEEEKNEHAH